MKNIAVTLGAAGNTAWQPLHQNNQYFGVSVAVTLDATANLTYTVQHSFNDPWKNKVAIITRSTTTATLIFHDPITQAASPHGLTTSDSVIVTGAGAPFDGTFNVASVVDANTITYTVANSGATSSANPALASPMIVFNNATLATQTTQGSSNYAFPVRAVRLNISSWSAGNATLHILQPGSGQ